MLPLAPGPSVATRMRGRGCGTGLAWPSLLEMGSQCATKRCRALGHPEFLLEDPEGRAAPSDLAWFADYLERCVAGGGRFQPGNTIGLGAAELRIVDRGQGWLAFEEPDGMLPMAWTSGVGRSLAELALQRFVAESVALLDRLTFPAPRQLVLTCDRVWTSTDYVLFREAPTAEATGWFVGCGDHTHSHAGPSLQRVTTYELTTRKPVVAPYLALPDGTTVLWQLDVFSLELGGARRPPAPGSYLAQRIWRASEGSIAVDAARHPEVSALLDQGHVHDATHLWHQQVAQHVEITLPAAMRTVEAFAERRRTLQREAIGASALVEEVVALLREGRTVEAVKHHRASAGGSLIEAKAAVDAIRASRGLPG
jgi:ribosomal protein L7/L12